MAGLPGAMGDPPRLLDPVFRLGLSSGLPLHVAGFIGPAPLQSLDVVYHVAATSSRGSAG
jgi:hypothetical protein